MSDLGGFSMFDLFREEAETHCASLEAGLLELEADPSDGGVAIEPLMRAAHSVKGAARIIGLDIAVGLAHAMEDVFVAVQEGKEVLVSERVDQLLSGTDLLRSLSELDETAIENWSAENGPRIAETIRGLEKAVAPGTPAEAEAPEEAPEEVPVEVPPAVTAPAEPPPPTPPAVPEVSDDETPAEQDEESRTVRVDSGRLERMMQLAGEVMITSRRFQGIRERAADFDQRLEEMESGVGSALREDGDPLGALRQEIDDGRLAVTDLIDDLDGLLRRTEEISADLYGQVLGSRMRPFQDGGHGFPRMIRDLAKKLGKKVRFEVQGGRTRVDREILASLEAPLTHVLRNAVDHGIELPEARKAAGKPETATLVLEARHHAGMLLVRVREDGGGIDPESLRRKIVERGFVDEGMASRLDGPELHDFLFLPGFSTASAITEVSGRGVGLDVVQSMVHEVGGAVRVESTLGVGTTFELQLPVTRSVVRAALVEVDGEPFGLPLARLSRVTRVPASEITTVEGRRQFQHEGGMIGLIRFASLLGLPETEGDPEVESVVVVGDSTGRCGLVVDRFLGEQDLVVRRLDSRFGSVPHVGAAAMLEDGSPLFILDVEDVLKSIRQLLGDGRLRGTGRDRISSDDVRAKRVLVVEDSITVREVERQILVQMGLEVETAVDGVDGWNALQSGQYDLVVTDIDMPRMNGIELVTTLRADERFKTIPVIVVSYKDREADRLAGMQAGADAYLTKGSFREGSFVTAVRDILGIES
ncbi:MAG: hybrid sensor histidine kinase/response regulator [Phycisphaerales bacterium]|jgi:two-component system sensor histidine kinase and response regulator WspE|nr:hybrid sensor histidine kinase/response regulator [Phycisphaerales bacterium]